jgi:Fur family ferric uptake transcriptional regulator
MIAATQSNHPLGLIGSPEVLEVATQRMRQSNLRITKPRLAIIRTMMRFDGPISIERLHQEIGKDSCDLVTLYRCASTFERLGIVRRSYQHNGTCLFELNVGQAHRSHVVCRSCNRTERVDGTGLDDVLRSLQDRGFSDVGFVAQFFGVCSACRQAATDRMSGIRVERQMSPGIATSNSIDSASL